jgi:hypothetical protein
MASAITLLELRTAVYDRADMTNSSFPDETQTNRLINAAVDELYELLVSLYEDYFYATEDIALVAGTESYNIASTHYKTVKVYYTQGNDRHRLKRFNMNELEFEEAWQNSTHQNQHLRYRIMGNQMIFSPRPTASGTVEHWYIPEVTHFALSGGDATALTINVPVHWEEFLIVSAAIPLLDREESDSSALRATKAEIKQRIMLAAQNRDAGEPTRVNDARGRFNTSRRFLR